LLLHAEGNSNKQDKDLKQAVSPVLGLFSSLVSKEHKHGHIDNNLDNGNDARFSLTIYSEQDSTALSGYSEFGRTPSSYSIYLRSDDGRCALHFLNMKTPLRQDIYQVEEKEDARTAMVCVLNEADPVERMASISGKVEITRIEREIIAGNFSMILKGGVTETEYEISGQFESLDDLQSFDL